MAHLLSLQAECQYLEKHAQSIIELLKGERDNLRVQLNAECSQDLQSQIQSTKASLVAEKTAQKVHQDLVKVAEKEVEHAEQLEDEKNFKDGCSEIVGTILGFLARPFCDTLAELEGAVDRPKDNLQDRQQALRDANEAVRHTEQLIANLQKELDELSATLSEEAGKVSEAIVFQSEAAEV